MTRLFGFARHIGAMEGLPPHPMHLPDDEHTKSRRMSANPLTWIIYLITHIGRQALALLGLILVLISIPVALATPVIPVGLPIGIIGVALLGRNSVWGNRLLNHILSLKPELERLAPNWLMKLVFAREKQEKYRKKETT